MKSKLNNQGFTLIELLVVILIIAALFALSTINLGQSQSTASLSTSVDQLATNLKSQQLFAMSGQISPDGTQLDHGIDIGTSKYTLFTNSAYAPGDSSNFVVDVSPVVITTNFPSNQVVFNKGDGSVLNFNPNTAEITLSLNGATRTISINRFGATTFN